MITFESAVSAFSGDPFIIVRWGNESGQMTPDEAREHALKILETANAAEGDAAMVAWAQEKMGVDQQTSAQILMDLRQFRTRGITIEQVDP